MDKPTRELITRYVNELIALPVTERVAYGMQHCEEFVRSYPKLFYSICDDKDEFNTMFLKYMLKTLETHNNVDEANDKVVAELQKIYILPVLEKLDDIRKKATNVEETENQ